MKKIVLGLFLIVIASGCSVSATKTYTMTLDDDEVKVTLKTSGGYDIKKPDSNNENKFTKSGNVIAYGYFEAEDNFDEIYEYVTNKEDSTIKKVKTENRDDAKILCYYYSVEDVNICRAKIKKSIIYSVYNYSSYDDVIRIIDRLSFK